MDVSSKKLYHDLFSCSSEVKMSIGLMKGNIGPERPYMFEVTDINRPKKKKIARRFLGKRVLIKKQDMKSSLKFKIFV